jgi:hypothetical protein
VTNLEAYHPLVKRLLDGEIGVADLPAEHRREGEEALRLMEQASVVPVEFSPWFERRVMSEVRRRPRPAERGIWHRLMRSREIRLQVRPAPWLLAAAAALVAVLVSPRSSGAPATVATASPAATYVRFVFYAPHVSHVGIAGSFNEWKADEAPLQQVGTTGLWTTTLRLPAGQHLYAFVLDGNQWLPDPAAPAVDDGFGRRNSVMTVPNATGGWL